MKSKKRWHVAAFGICLSLGVLAANAQGNSTDHSAKSDNSAVNTRDRTSDEPTADQGRNNASDRDIMQKIRKAVVADGSLSTYGHNVKIISQDGKVTLKGPVHSDAERKSIEDKAVAVAGQGNVTDELSVKDGSAAH